MKIATRLIDNIHDRASDISLSAIRRISFRLDHAASVLRHIKWAFSEQVQCAMKRPALARRIVVAQARPNVSIYVMHRITESTTAVIRGRVYYHLHRNRFNFDRALLDPQIDHVDNVAMQLKA